MEKTLITAAGLEAMARIFVSCKPIMAEIMKVNQLYLIARAKEGSDVEYDSYMAELPLSDPTYGHILDFAYSLGKQNIDAEVVYLFFGGQPHFEKISQQVNDPKNKLKEDFAKRIFFAHILLPVRIVSLEHKINAVYENCDLRVEINNLVMTDKASLREGQMVLVHYASVICPYPDKEIVESLLNVQADRLDFVDACNYVKKIDYLDFWDLSRWTEEIIKDRKL